MSERISVLIADDHPLLRKGLRSVIADDPGLDVVGEAGDGDDALRLIKTLTPQVIVIDLDMPRRDGFGVVREMRARQLPGAVIVLTMHGEPDLLNEALALDIRGYVIKDSAATDIVSGIRSVHQGRHFISAALSAHLIAGGAAPAAGTRTGLAALTPTERRILRLVADGKSSKEIADECGSHFRTVENHRVNICTKLDLHGSHALLKFAMLNRASL
jgi:DNA-binding NarL/FixJ family response regulator